MYVPDTYVYVFDTVCIYILTPYVCCPISLHMVQNFGTPFVCVYVFTPSCVATRLTLCMSRALCLSLQGTCDAKKGKGCCVSGIPYGVATISRMLKNIGLFCKRDLQKRHIFCKETYIFKHPTNGSHPIAHNVFLHRLYVYMFLGFDTLYVCCHMFSHTPYMLHTPCPWHPMCMYVFDTLCKYIYFDTLCVLPHVLTHSICVAHPMSLTPYACVYVFTPYVCRRMSDAPYIAHPMSVAGGNVRRQKGQGLLHTPDILYIRICIYVYTYMCICIYVYIHICICIYVHTPDILYICIYVYIHICVYVSVYIHVYIGHVRRQKGQGLLHATRSLCHGWNAPLFRTAGIVKYRALLLRCRALSWDTEPFHRDIGLFHGDIGLFCGGPKNLSWMKYATFLHCRYREIQGTFTEIFCFSMEI